MTWNTLNTRRCRRAQARSGAMLILCCLAMIVFLILAVLIVDVGWMSLAQAELQASADSATRAALQSYVEDNSKGAVKNRIRKAQKVGRRFFEANPIVNEKVRVDDREFEFGTYVNNRFDPNTSTPNAVRLSLSQARHGGFRTLLAPVIGISTFQQGVESISASRTMDVIVLIDASRSMARIVGSGSTLPPGVKSELEPPGRGSRWLAVVDAVEVFLNRIARNTPSTRVSLVVLGGGNFNRVVTPWDDTRARIETHLESVATATEPIMEAMDQYSQWTLPHSTSIYAGLEESLAELEANSNPSVVEQAIILLSDGQQSKFESRDPMQLVGVAKQQEIVIHTVYFSGNGKGAAGMNAYATQTGGEAIIADSEQELNDAFAAIAAIFKISLVQ